MRALVIASSGQLGGAEISLLTTLAHRRPDDEIEALVIGSGPLGHRIRALGVPAREAAGLDGRPSPARAVRFARSLTRLLRETPTDVVWAVGQKAAAMAALPARIARVPLVWQKVDLSRDALVAPALAMAVSGVIAVSDATARALGPQRERRLLGIVSPAVRDEIARAADSREREPQLDDAPVIGTLGRLVPYKGHHLLIEAAAILRTEFPGLRVLLGGPPASEHADYASRLRALAESLEIGHDVEVLGRVEAEEVLSRLDVYVAATHRAGRFGGEGAGMAVLEASAFGLPVVAVAGGGVRETVRDGATGRVIDAPDPRLIAEAVAGYLRSPDARRCAGEAGRALATEFSADLLSARLWSLLERADSSSSEQPTRAAQSEEHAAACRSPQRDVVA